VDLAEAHKSNRVPYNQGAIENVERVLGEGPYTHERIDPGAVAGITAGGAFVAGWRIHHHKIARIPVLDVYLDQWFPASLPKILIPDGKRPDGVSELFLRIPHVNKDGSVCVAPESCTINQDNCGLATLELINRAIEILQNGISGSNREDFIFEVESYWDKISHTVRIAAAINLVAPSRRVSAVFDPARSTYFVAEDADALRDWTKKLTGRKIDRLPVLPAFFVWRKEPLYPEQYPRTNQQLISIVADSRICSGDDLAVAARLSEVPIVIAFQSGVGTAAIGCSIVKMNGQINGFRPKSISGRLVLERFGRHACQLHSVDKASPDYIRWRSAGEQISERISEANIMIVGCGALGADVAMLLVKAGFRKFFLVDPDQVTWDNVGRHLLGASYVGCRKVDAVESALTSHSPYIKVQTQAKRVEMVVTGNPEIILSQDLIISMTANYLGEKVLNDWARRNRRPVLFGWLEPHGVAGQCLLVTPKGGCFECGKEDSGQFAGRVIDWNAEQAIDVPACGGTFMPHGAVAAGPTKTMIVQLAIDSFFGKVTQSELRTFIGDVAQITRLGGRIRSRWVNSVDGDQAVIGRIFAQTWETDAACKHCEQSGEG
jgi:molybdopterin/thiamine biosynthesis adenylyltransferase